MWFHIVFLGNDPQCVAFVFQLPLKYMEGIIQIQCSFGSDFSSKNMQKHK